MSINRQVQASVLVNDVSLPILFDFCLFVFSDALKEIRQFEESVLYKAVELSDTTVDDTNLIERPGKGTPFKFEDVCKQMVLKREGKDDVSRVSAVYMPTWDAVCK